MREAVPVVIHGFTGGDQLVSSLRDLTYQSWGSVLLKVHWWRRLKPSELARTRKTTLMWTATNTEKVSAE